MRGCGRTAPRRQAGSRTVKVVSPGLAVEGDGPAVRLRDGRDDGRDRVRCCRRPGCVSRRRARTARRRPAAAPRDPGTVVARRRAGPAAVGDDARSARRCRRGVRTGVAEQVGDDLVQPGGVARDLDRLVGQVELPDVVGRGGVRVADRVDDAARRGRRSRGRADGPRRGGRAAAGRRRARSCGSPRTRCGRSRSVTPRRDRLRLAAGQLRIARGSRRAGCAARGWRRRRTGAPVPRSAGAR